MQQTRESAAAASPGLAARAEGCERGPRGGRYEGLLSALKLQALPTDCLREALLLVLWDVLIGVRFGRANRPT